MKHDVFAVKQTKLLVVYTISNFYSLEVDISGIVSMGGKSM